MGNKRKFKNSNNRKSVAYARQMKRLKKDHIIENKSTQSNDTHTNYSNSVQTANPTSHIEESTNSNSVTYQPSCSLDITKSYSSECTTSNDIFSQLIDDLEILEDIGIQTVEKPNNIEELEISVQSVATKPMFRIEGRRIVDFNYLFDQIKMLSEHNSGFGCTLSNINIVREKLTGLESIIYFQCNFCNQRFEINLCGDSQDEMTINHAVVTGSMLIGSGQTNINELLTAMDLPNLSCNNYNKYHSDVSNWWKTAAENSMKEAAKEEANLAIENGDLIDGIPAITVVADACWSKRSYKNNYSASSGAATIIGHRTGKVLFMEVRNKYCIICARSLLKKQSPPIHNCNRNHVGSSTSMEQASIVEGFKSSIATHTLIYKTLIADGDASTYKKILDTRPYPNVQVEKIECSNHLLRNYTSKLMQLLKDTSIPLAERKLLTTDRITRLRTAIKAAARFRNAQNIHITEKNIKLKDDILNSPKHIFGEHSVCEEYYCTEEKKKERNLVPLSKILITKLMVYTSQIALNSKSLLYNVNNNRAEQFNSIIAKHVGGKRINFSLKNSYTARCHAAVVAFNTGKAQYKLYKANFDKSPRKSIKMLEMRRCKRNRNRAKPGYKKKIIFQNRHDYGEACGKPDLAPEQYETTKRLFLENLKGIVENRHEIERDTVLQAESALWLELRRCLLTASSFSKVCKRRSNISSAPLVKSLIYSYSLDNVPAVEYGKNNEKTAIKQLELQEGIVVQKCGLFIDQENFFLGASPDGLFDEGIVEIKCPYSARNMDPEQAILEKKIKFWKIDGTINTNHDWYFQIQGQLHISQKNVCLFAVWTGQDFIMKTTKIMKDDIFWRTKMEPKLLAFYDKCFLPEMVDPRKGRSMPIREVQF